MDYKYSVTAEVREIIKGSKQDPINIVEEAKKSKGDYNEIWVVFDRDRERDNENQQAMELAKKSKINVVFSSISFEHWLILHFEKNKFAFERSDCESRSTTKNPIFCSCNGLICATTYLKKHYPDFKKARLLLYDDLQDKNNKALENSAWLRNQQQNFSDIHLNNPYTDVDSLVIKLLELEEIQYLGIGNAFLFEDISIKVTNVEINQNQILVSLHLHNQSKTAFLLNNLLKFTVVDNSGISYDYNHFTASILNPNNSQNHCLTFSVANNSGNLQFKAITTKKYFLVDL